MWRIMSLGDEKMDMFIYKEFERLITRHNVYVKDHNRFLWMFRKYITEDEINIFYPKKIFIPNSTVEVLAVKKDHLIILIDDAEQIIVKTYPLKKIINLVVCETNDSGNVTLVIRFENGENVSLNNENDTGMEWRKEYGEQIFKIYKTLIT